MPLLWLRTIYIFVFLMIGLGGVTRLTQSGLSMVDWNPIMGTLPPLSAEAWEGAFAQYQKFPEFIQVNHAITLAQFKQIFFWEYLHRLWGRLIAIVFLIPWVYFVIRKKISRQLALYSFGGFVLGGLQGLLGWYMVKSGLVDRPSVSHYRLAAHLLLSTLIIAYFYWLSLGGQNTKSNLIKMNVMQFLKTNMVLSAGLSLVIVQIFYGALVAGLKAGYFYNTFPKMGGEWFPANLLSLSPLWLNFFENAIGVQFIHRLLGIGIVLLFTWKYKIFHEATAIAWMQGILGIATLILSVPIALGVAHQLTAIVLLLSIVRILKRRQSEQFAKKVK